MRRLRAVSGVRRQMVHLVMRGSGRSTPFARALWAVYPCVYDHIWDNALTHSIANAVVSELPEALPVEEVGAGTGLFTQRIVNAGLTLTTSSEPNLRMRERLRRRLPSIAVADANLETLSPDRPEPCSVVAANVVHLTVDPMAAIATLRRRATRGGRVIVVTPSPEAALSTIARAMRRCGASRLIVLRFLALHVLLGPSPVGIVLAVSNLFAVRRVRR